MRLAPLLLVAACGSSTTAPTGSAAAPTGSAAAPAGSAAAPAGSAAAPATSADDCEARARAAGAFLAAMDHELNPVILGDAEPVVRTDVPVRQRDLAVAPAVVVGPQQLSFLGKPLDAGALRATRDELTRASLEDPTRGPHAPDPDRLHLVIDRRAPWRLVVRAVEACHAAGFDHVTVVFARPPAAAPPHTKVDDEVVALIKGAGPEGAATALGRYASKKVAGCPALISLFGQIAGVEATDRASTMLAGIEPALRACHCGADPAEITSLMWELTGNQRPVGAIDVVLDPKARPLALAGDVTWADASAQLRSDARTLWAAVRRP